jgi:hypothetical protein
VDSLIAAASRARAAGDAVGDRPARARRWLAPAAGGVSRRSCYSPLRWRSTRLPSPRRSGRVTDKELGMTRKTDTNDRPAAPARAAEIDPASGETVRTPEPHRD